LVVAAVSVVATATATQLLKTVTSRQRPNDSSSNDSFPSGHTSFSFAASTFLARRFSDEHPGRWDDASVLFYLPAIWVGVDRVEGQRHFASDVVAGAALGFFMTNWIYNAHYPESGGAAKTIYEPKSRFEWSLAPVIDSEHLGIALRGSF
jgi:membrane-associated phospholipid phosphatase